MKLLIFILFFVPPCLIPCDWEVINYEPETYIYYITPMNETELVSYSYDGEGNMFYQYSSDNGSTWEVIREEKFVKFEHQPEQITKVFRANEHTILFVRKVRQILSFDTETKTWDSTLVEYAGSPLGQRNYYKVGDNIFIILMDENDEEIYEPFVYTANTSNPLDFTKAPLFDKNDPTKMWIRIDYGLFDNELYFSRYIDDTFFDRIYKYNVITKNLDSIDFKKEYEFVKFYQINDNIYFTDIVPLDANPQQSRNNGFYKYNSKTQEAELLYKFDHNYYGEPYLSLLSDSTYSLIINGVYYLFENDVFIKKHLPVQIDCPECEASKKSLVYNKYNGYYYYTTNGFCLFRSADYLDDILSSVNTNTESNGEIQKSFIVNDNHFEYQINADEIVLSTSLFNINGQKMNAEYDIGLANMINISMPVDLIKGVYILRIVTNKNDYEIKLMKQ